MVCCLIKACSNECVIVLAGSTRNNSIARIVVVYECNHGDDSYEYYSDGSEESAEFHSFYPLTLIIVIAAMMMMPMIAPQFCAMIPKYPTPTNEMTPMMMVPAFPVSLPIMLNVMNTMRVMMMPVAAKMLLELVKSAVIGPYP